MAPPAWLARLSFARVLPDPFPWRVSPCGKDAMTTPAVTPPLRRLAPLAPLLLPLACLLWAYGATFAELYSVWNNNPQYSHGFLVPVFAGFLLWLRRDKLDVDALRPSLWGVVVLGAALGLRLVGAWRYYVSLDAISLVPCVAGLVLLIGGMAAWRWAWPAVLFLAFMIPLPYFAAVAMSGQLQTLATITSTFIMQTLGMPALAEGNVILLNDNQIGIVEACSGLRMLVVFFALSTAVVLVVQRHWIDRAIILFSAIPIALISNIVRVTATGVMYEAGYSEMASHFFHDVAGWFMMPFALGMLWVELKVLDKLFIDTPSTAPARPAVARRATSARPTSNATTRPTGANRPVARGRRATNAPGAAAANKAVTPEPTLEPVSSETTGEQV